MAIVGGLDIHRRQITYDYLDTGSGETRRGQLSPATRLELRAWLARFAGQPTAFALEATTGWRFVAEELERAGIAAHLAEPADTRALRGPKRRAKTDRTDAHHLRELLRAGTLPESWMPPAHQPPEVRVDPHRDLAVLPYSSGTTGLPKGVMLTHHNLVANLCQFQPVVDLGEEETGVAVLPFFHLYGQVVLMAAALWQGGTLVTMPRFDLEQFLTILQDYRVSRAAVVPPIVLALAKHPLVDRFDLSALRFVLSGAAPLSAELEEACGRRLGCVVGQGYGLTETGPVLTAHPPDGARIRHGSAGQLLPNTEAKVVDLATGEALGRNQDGELCFRGPQVMRGYLNAPEATAQMLDADGWLRTGDTGHVDDDGYVYVVDRVKELIKYKGHQVAPAELEAVLVSHPRITDAAVIRVADEAAGEVPKAFVVATAELSAQEVIEYVAERVAPYKKVRAVEFIDQIPKSLSGKILRRLLMERDRHAAATGSPPS
jgi:acyl-CoA synthetase (AMP-forming)/AMP-acid ligase II